MGDSLLGKTALVAGASSGIGAASTRHLVRDGAAVVMMGRRERELAEARDEILGELPDARIEIHAGDGCEAGAVQAALEHAHAFSGQLDIVVSSVGGCDVRPLLMLDEATLMHEYRINVVSSFLLIKHGVPLMRPGGAFVFVSTACAVQTFPGLSSYSAAKAGLERLVRAAAFELSQTKIRVNAVRPGMTRTGGTVFMYESQDLVDAYAAETILGRTGEPDDIARAIRFLAGPESGWITGQSISVDGGQEQGKIPDMLDGLFGTEKMRAVRAGRVPVD